MRRAAAQGALRAHRIGSRRLRLSPGEREYLGGHWQLLFELRQALRTERRGRRVDLADLAPIEARAPLLLPRVDEGRVLVDRDAQWDRLLARAPMA